MSAEVRGYFVVRLDHAGGGESSLKKKKQTNKNNDTNFGFKSEDYALASCLATREFAPQFTEW